MTRKHYIGLAALLRAEVDTATTDAERDQLVRIAHGWAAICHADNPRFDRARFLTAALGPAGLDRG